MLTIIVPGDEYYDGQKGEFVYTDEVALQIEHSLVSLSKWESFWEVPFLGDKPKSTEQTLDYVRTMTITPNIDPEVYERLSEDNVQKISSYIEAKMTATWFSEKKGGKGNKEVITAELLYYWMISLSIPFECQNWHLNRLITLVQVCSKKQEPDKKLSKSELMARNRTLNEQRKAQHKTSG